MRWKSSSRLNGALVELIVAWTDSGGPKREIAVRRRENRKLRVRNEESQGLRRQSSLNRNEIYS